MNNISRFYYKDYFSGIDFSYLLGASSSTSKAPDNVVQTIGRRNSQLKKSQLHVIEANPLVGDNKFSLKVAYPGLATGTGITHETGIAGEFKLGMHFDYTYGMPVIYGSSVKGVLRSAFPDKKDKEKIRKCKEGQIREYLGVGFENIDVEALRDQIFCGLEDGKPVSIYKRDIFFDAVIVKPYHRNGEERILESDSITPHGDNPLKNPVPITFMKIASGVVMEFRFDLKDFASNGQIIVSKEQKLSLLKKILLDFGVGAKTNVGYGQFTEI